MASRAGAGAFERNAAHLRAHAPIAVEHGRPHQPADPVPIPGGFTLPDGTVFHVTAPGPAEQGFQGLDVDPSTIGDFSGFSAIAYPVGTATDADGNRFDMSNDMRVYRGTYVGEDGHTHEGTFGFI